MRELAHPLVFVQDECHIPPQPRSTPPPQDPPVFTGQGLSPAHLSPTSPGPQHWQEGTCHLPYVLRLRLPSLLTCSVAFFLALASGKITPIFLCLRVFCPPL